MKMNIRGILGKIFGMQKKPVVEGVLQEHIDALWTVMGSQAYQNASALAAAVLTVFGDVPKEQVRKLFEFFMTRHDDGTTPPNKEFLEKSKARDISKDAFNKLAKARGEEMMYFVKSVVFDRANNAASASEKLFKRLFEENLGAEEQIVFMACIMKHTPYKPIFNPSIIVDPNKAKALLEEHHSVQDELIALLTGKKHRFKTSHDKTAGILDIINRLDNPEEKIVLLNMAFEIERIEAKKNEGMGIPMMEVRIISSKGGCGNPNCTVCNMGADLGKEATVN